MKENPDRILLGKVEVPPHAEKWMKFVSSDGKVYAQPFQRKGSK